MDSFFSPAYSVIFILVILLLIYWYSSSLYISRFGDLSKVHLAKWTLDEFMDSHIGRPSESYLFAEQAITSAEHKFVGRFDNAVIRRDKVPVLELIIERKYPKDILPNRARPEDVFQSALYILALMESGVSCESSKLIIIYCKQSDAIKCLGKNDMIACICCRKNRIFSRRFNPKKVLKTLEKLDGFWYKNRKPRPSASLTKCRICPYGKDGVCKHSILE